MLLLAGGSPCGGCRCPSAAALTGDFANYTLLCFLLSVVPSQQVVFFLSHPRRPALPRNISSRRRSPRRSALAAVVPLMSQQPRAPETSRIVPPHRRPALHVYRTAAFTALCSRAAFSALPGL